MDLIFTQQLSYLKKVHKVINIIININKLMSFPPIPPLTLNVSDMEISKLKLDDITFEKVHFDLPLKPLYILFIGLFILNLVQTFFMITITYHIRSHTNRIKNTPRLGYLSNSD